MLDAQSARALSPLEHPLVADLADSMPETGPFEQVGPLLAGGFAGTANNPLVKDGAGVGSQFQAGTFGAAQFHAPPLTAADLRASGDIDPNLAASLGLNFAVATAATVGDSPLLNEAADKAPGATVSHIADQGSPLGAQSSSDRPTPAGQLSGIQMTNLQGNTLLVAGFEVDEGFSPGFIQQNSWGIAPGNVTEPNVSTLNPQSGAQHVRIAQEPALAGGATVAAFSPHLGALPASHYSASVDASISATGGADYFVYAQAPSEGKLTAGFRFRLNGDIWVLDDLDPGTPGLNWIPTGASWNAGTYASVTIEVDSVANTIEYFYAGTSVYTTTAGVFAGTAIEQVLFASNNANSGDVGDFDNLVVSDLGADLPDLMPIPRPTWNDLIPIGITQLQGGDAHDYEGPYYDNQPLYVNRAVANVGQGTANQYAIRLQVTGPGGTTFDSTGLSLDPNLLTSFATDQQIGPLSAGTHTFKLWVDFLDSANETDELNNYYERTITVLPAGAPAAQPVSVEPLGVSDGVSWFAVNETSLDFGEERAYSVDLVAGQRISASVQTPEGNPFGFGTTTAVPIPDDGTTIISEITVSGSLTVDDLDLQLLVDHRNVGDLEIFLVPPGGAPIELSTNNGGSRNGYFNTVFDDEAPLGIDDPATMAPFFGRHRPESLLSAVDGTDATGTWQLQITDTSADGSADGTLLSWALQFNQGIDPALTIAGPDGELAENDDVLAGLLDSAIVDVVVPTTGTYTFNVSNVNTNAGGYTLEAGIYESTVPTETGDTTDLDPERAPNGNVALLGIGDGIGQQDVYTITLNAGEAVTLAATTPGGFYGPGLEISGPGGFTTADAILLPGPAGDQVLLFTAPQTGQYTITVAYPFTQPFLNVVDTGSYALSVILSDTATNDSLATARPISVFDYRDPVTTTSLFYDLEGFQGLWRGQIDSPSDTDFYHLGRLESGELIRVTVQRDASSQLFPFLVLRNSAGEIVRAAQSFRFDPLTGSASFEPIISQTDDYFLQIIPEPAQLGESTISTGAYLLFYSGFGNAEDAYEDNDSQAEVDAAAAGALNSPNLGPLGAVTVVDELALMEDSEDWFRFQTPLTGSRGDYLRIEFSHAAGNLDLELIDESGQVVRQSRTMSDNERISLQGLAAGLYYARVTGVGGARNPSYDLRVQIGSPDHRLLSAPFTTDASYSFKYELQGAEVSTAVLLEGGENVLVVEHASGGPEPFQLLFDVTRVGSLADQTSTQYDLLGNPSRQTDALGRDTTFIYDGLGRLALVNGPLIGDQSVYLYDGNDNVTQIGDTALDSVTAYAYDDLDRVTSITLPNAAGTLQYEYDLADRVTKIVYPDATGVTYGYDAAGRLQTVTAGADVTTYSYFPDGQLETTTLPNGIVASYTYDAYGRLRDLAYVDGLGGLITSLHYTLDDNGNRTQVEIRRADTDTPDPQDFFASVYAYQYDSLDRLTRAEYPDGSVVVYTYDANGNRVTTSTDPDGGGPATPVVETYEYGQDNRLLRITSGGLALKEFFYDPRGNVVMVVTPTDTFHYEYDYRNLLTRVTDGTHVIEYLYDGNGDRVAKIVDGERTTYVNDPNQEFTQVLLELDEAGAVEASYTYGLSRISGVLPGAATAAYYLADALGSTTDLTDATGALVQSYSYDAFGALRPLDAGGVNQSLANEFTFAGERIEIDTGLSYNRARYYDPATGRFMAKDPIGFVDGVNPYHYAANNPVISTDPSGLRREGPPSPLEEHRFVHQRMGQNDRGTEAEIRRGIQASERAARAERDLERFRRELRESNRRNEIERTRRRIEREVRDARRRGGFQSSSGSSFRSRRRIRGGVLLDQAVGFVGNLSSLTGATVDPVTGQVVLLGEGDAGGNVPDLSLDDFVTAVRAVFASAEDPGVTLDPQPGHESDPSFPQLVGLFGGLEDTDMGWVVLEADRVMKTLSAAKDNVSGAPVSSNVPGYKSMLDRFVMRVEAGGSGSGQSRFWFVPTDVKLVRSPAGDSFVFDKTAVQLLTEDLLVGNFEVDPDAQEFADWFTENYDAIAQEEYTVYDYPNETVGGEIPSQLRIFERLEQVAKAIAFARFLYDNNIPIDFSWIDNYEVPQRNTPLESRTVQNTASSGNFTITITGGVTMDAANAYLPGSGASALSNGVLGSRPDELAQQWDVNFGGQDQSAVALQLNSEHVDGQESRADVDLSYQTPGEVAFELVRYYRSVEPTPGPFGFGWQFVPFDMDFSRPEFFSSDRSPFTFLNGLREGEIRIVDRAADQVLSFLSTLHTQKTPGGGFGHIGLNADGVPDFIPGGSEQPDGSTLVQDAATLDYRLTRPEGRQMVFDRSGRLLQVLDARSRAITYGYSGKRVTSISDSGGQTITLMYDAQGRVDHVDGVDGEVVTYQYDGAGNLTSARRRRQGVDIEFAYTYDADHRITMVTMPDQVVDTTSVTDILGRVSEQGDARGNDFHSNFDPAQRTTTTTDMTSGATRMEKTDSLGRTIESVDELGRKTRFFYDVVRVFGPNYHPVTNPTDWTYVQTAGTNRQPSLVLSPAPARPVLYFEYDANGNVTRSEDVARGGDANDDGIDDNPLLFEYDGNNNLIRSTDARGIVTESTYNAFNQRESMTTAVGTAVEATWLWQYDPATGYLVQQTDPSGVVTQFEYDALGRQIRQTIAPALAEPMTTRSTYDTFSRLETERIVMDPGDASQDRVTTFTYDGRDQLTSTTLEGDPPGGDPALTSTSSYDPLSGRVLTQIDFNGNSTAFVYDETTGDLLQEAAGYGLDINNQLIQVDSDGAITHFRYDRFGNLERLIDPIGNATAFKYDEVQQLVHTTSLGSTGRVASAMGSSSGLLASVGTEFAGELDAAVVSDELRTEFANQGSPLSAVASVVVEVPGSRWLVIDQEEALLVKLELGALNAYGSGLVVAFSEPIDAQFIDDGIDIFVVDSSAAHVPGSSRFSSDMQTLFWFPNAGTLQPPSGTETYEVTLKASAAGEFATVGGALLDGEFFGLFPSGDNTPGGDFVFDWLVDDHGNDAPHATATTIPTAIAGNLEFAGDADWFSVDVVEGSRFGFEVVLATQAGALFDSVLRLYDLDGETLLELNDDKSTGEFGSRIEWEAPRTGRFFLSVRGFADRRTGHYELKIDPLADDHADESGSATPVDVPSLTAGQLELASDADVFSFDAIQGQEYRITTILAGLENALEDSVLSVLDTDGTTVLAANNNFFVGNPAAFLYWQAPADGTYFVQVTSSSALFDGTYELVVSIDDHGEHSGIATPVSVNSTTPGDLEVKQDRDWFSFSPTPNSHYRLDVELGTLPNSRLLLVDSDGSSLLDVNDDYNGLRSTIFWTAPASPGTYYLRVDGFEGSGTYTLTVTQLSDDHGDDEQSATPVAVPSTTPGDIEMPGDVDWFSFDAVAGIKYRIQTILGNLADSVLNLYEAGGVTPLEANDDVGGPQSRIDWRAPASGTYFVDVLAFGAEMAGTYDLDISQLEETSPVGNLVSPLPDTVVTADDGYVDVAWSDAGLGIDPDSVDATDVGVTGVAVQSVVAQGGNVWRYFYQGNLPDGVIEVTLLDKRVLDLAGNANAETMASFIFDSGAPTADVLDVAPDPRGDGVEEITIAFSEPVSGFGLEDLLLTVDGGPANLLTSGSPTLVPAGQPGVFTLGNLSSLTDQPGVYELRVVAGGSAIADQAGQFMTGDATDSWEVVALATIEGIQFHDLNTNGAQDAGEPPLAGRVVYLDMNNNRRRDVDEPFDVTDENGQFQFTNIFPGDYTVATELPPRWTATLPSPAATGSNGPAEASGFPPFPFTTITTTGSPAPTTPLGALGHLQSTATAAALPESASTVGLDSFRSDSRFSQINGRGYAVVILDTGIDTDHSFFGPDADGDGVADRAVFQFDFADNDPDASDFNGHGTHVTSIVASADETHTGVAPAVDVIHLKVFRDDDTGSFAFTESALQWVVNNAVNYNIVSVNMSLSDFNPVTGLSGNYTSSQSLFGLGDELAALAAMNVIVVSGAGNDFFGHNSLPGVGYPAADPNSIAVGATWDADNGFAAWQSGAVDFTTAADRIASFSQRHGTLTDVFAPGALIAGAGLNNTTATLGGTSQAAPHVAGVAVLAQQLAERELGRRLTPQEFRDLLRSTGVIINDGDDEQDNVQNTGLDFSRIDVMALGEAILGMSGAGPGNHAVQVAAGQVLSGVNFGSVEVVGWADRQGQNSAQPDDGGSDVAVDASGNTIVVGSNFFVGDEADNPGDAAAFIEKYSPSGQLQWQSQLSSTGDVRARHVGTDHNGNIYIAGNFTGTVDFDPTGAQPGNVDMVASLGAYDGFLLKLSDDGAFEWVRRLGGSSTTWDRALGLAVDQAENVYVSGEFGGTVDLDRLNTHPGDVDVLQSAGASDIFVAQFDSSGNLQWAWRAGGSADDSAGALAVDSRGHAHVGGTYMGEVDFDGDGTPDETSQGGADMVLLELDTAGNLIRYDVIGGTGRPEPTAIAVDPFGNRFISGFFQDNVDFDPTASGIEQRASVAGSFDAFVLRLGPSGSFGWVSQFGQGFDDRGRDVLFDPKGNVLVAGFFEGSVDFDPSVGAAIVLDSSAEDGFLLSLTPDGDFRRVRQIGGIGEDRIAALATGPVTDLAVTGYFSATVEIDTADSLTVLNSAGGKDAFVAKLLLSSQVVGRHIFYNDSFWDTDSLDNLDATDQTAIAPDKTALLPGEVASFANYTSFSSGINGVFIDVNALANPTGLTLADFEFRTGNDDNPSGWALAPNPLQLEVGAGPGGSDRIKLLWADNNLDAVFDPNEAVAKAWLQITLKATSATGLLVEDVHYWGNAPGETGNAADAVVNLSDVGGARNNQTGFGFATIDNVYDFNRDGRVTLSDVGLARTHQSGFTPLRWIRIPPEPAGPPAVELRTAYADSVPLHDAVSAHDSLSPSALSGWLQTIAGRDVTHVVDAWSPLSEVVRPRFPSTARTAAKVDHPRVPSVAWGELVDALMELGDGDELVRQTELNDDLLVALSAGVKQT